MKSRVLFIILCFIFSLLGGTSFAYTDYHSLGSPNGNAYYVSGWFSENSSQKNYKFFFTGIEVLPLSERKPSESEVDSFVREQLRWDCYIEFDKQRTNEYGNIQAYVWLKKPDREISEEFIRQNLLNAMLVEKGYARVIDYGPNQKYTKYLLKLESDARKNNLGIWK